MNNNDQLQALLYGKLEVEFVNPTYAEQLEIMRALVANPSAYSRLRIKGQIHPWITRLFGSSEEFRRPASALEQAAGTEARAE
jgi:hypothetical protein